MFLDAQILDDLSLTVGNVLHLSLHATPETRRKELLNPSITH